MEGGWYPNAHSAPSPPPKPTAEIKKNIWMHHCLLYIANHLSHKCCNDLNIYIQKWTGIYNEHNQRNKFLDSLSSNSFIPLILQPTRITSYCNTLLDNIISIVIDPDVMYSLTFTISDNLLQFAIIPICLAISQVINQTFMKETGLNLIKDFFYKLFFIDWEDLLKIDELNAKNSTKMYLDQINVY